MKTTQLLQFQVITVSSWNFQLLNKTCVKALFYHFSPNLKNTNIWLKKDGWRYPMSWIFQFHKSKSGFRFERYPPKLRQTFMLQNFAWCYECSFRTNEQKSKRYLAFETILRRNWWHKDFIITVQTMDELEIVKNLSCMI